MDWERFKIRLNKLLIYLISNKIKIDLFDNSIKFIHLFNLLHLLNKN